MTEEKRLPEIKKQKSGKSREIIWHVGFLCASKSFIDFRSIRFLPEKENCKEETDYKSWFSMLLEVICCANPIFFFLKCLKIVNKYYLFWLVQ